MPINYISLAKIHHLLSRILFWPYKWTQYSALQNTCFAIQVSGAWGAWGVASLPCRIPCYCCTFFEMAFVRGGLQNVAKRERGLYPSQRRQPAQRRILSGSFIRLEDASGLYRTEYREYPTGKDGKSGFPVLRFDGAFWMMVLGVSLSCVLISTGPPGSCPFLPIQTPERGDAGKTHQDPERKTFRHAVERLEGYCECCKMRYVLLIVYLGLFMFSIRMFC